MMSGEPLLEIRALSAQFESPVGPNRVLSEISLSIERGQIVGLVGESGSGKSVTAKLVLRLLRPAECSVTHGSIWFDGRDLLRLSPEEMRRLRGRRLAYVPQEPMNSLNPSLRIGRQLEMVLREHLRIAGREARDRAATLLQKMHVRDPERILRSYPFELSGGLRQRAALANAFLCDPDVLLADEPTTALDVTIQAEVLDLIRERARESGASVLFITHNMGVVWKLCQTTYVMRRGEIVEHGPTHRVLQIPSHPYTRSLLSALPERNEPRTPIPVSGVE
jgi:ABC-type dipeptide/oligopeptide/nickel transport system ATPase component